jgi:site-specific DNA recombinase
MSKRALAQAIASATTAALEPRNQQAVTYLRVSSKAQVTKAGDDEGYSLPAQRAACERKAAALGANVAAEFIEKGESGTSIKGRKALGELLERVTEGGIDYVIVHKIDRLARSRADDVQIAEIIRKSGAKLVSVSENIDETPSGMLLHGVMSAIAEFYSRNLAAEVMKGSNEKARRGGTPGRAPIGYLNVPELINGQEVRTIAIDPERGPLISKAFELYATGDYSTSELAAILEGAGLRSRPKGDSPSIPMGPNRIHTMLRNPYYIGIVTYNGKTSEGLHSKLTDERTFERVQAILSEQRTSGERCWRHHSYLRGTVYCGQCGSRLIYTRATGRNGTTYEYFVCLGRQRGTCSQPHHRVAAVERAIEDEYARIELSEEARDKIRADVQSYVERLDSQSDPERSQLQEDFKRLSAQERKLLQAHYNDHISDELFAEEQRRIRQERVAAESRLGELDVDHGKALERLEMALNLTNRIQAAYQLADPNTRRLFNQAIFSRIWIDTEKIADRELSEPFADLLQKDEERPGTLGELAGWSLEPDPLDNERTPESAEDIGGSNVLRMVPPAGLEPAISSVKGRRPNH